MDLQQLQQSVKQQLLKNGWDILAEQLYSVPVHTIEVSYHPVQRAVMDLLMKMMLISYERADIQEPDVLADILLVEPLFIHDLTNKMMNLGMLQRTDTGIIALTEKGRVQKEHGIFEEQLPLQSEQLYYSPTQAKFLTGDMDTLAELVDIPPASPYAVEALGTIDEAPLIDYLTELQPAPVDEEPQTFVSEMVQLESVQVHDVPILQFICYEPQQDKLFMKVFNSLTNEWDLALEELITAKERTSWQTYKNSEN